MGFLDQSKYILSHPGVDLTYIRIIKMWHHKHYILFAGNSYPSTDVKDENYGLQALVRIMRIKNRSKLGVSIYTTVANSPALHVKRVLLYRNPSKLPMYHHNDKLLYTYQGMKYYYHLIKEYDMAFSAGDWVVVKNQYLKGLSPATAQSFGDNLLFKVVSVENGDVTILSPTGNKQWHIAPEHLIIANDVNSAIVPNLLGKVNTAWTVENEPNAIYFGDYHQVTGIVQKNDGPYLKLIDFTGEEVLVPAGVVETKYAEQESAKKPVMQSVSSAPMSGMAKQKVVQPPGDRVNVGPSYLHVQVYKRKLPFAEDRNYGCAFNLPIQKLGFTSLTGSDSQYLPCSVKYNEETGDGILIVPFKMNGMPVKEVATTAKNTDFSNMVATEVLADDEDSDDYNNDDYDHDSDEDEVDSPESEV